MNDKYLAEALRCDECASKVSHEDSVIELIELVEFHLSTHAS